MPTDEQILKEIRENWDYVTSAWREVREEAELDVYYQTRGPWSKQDLADRGKRPTVVLDELGQYTNQIENEFRQNARAVKVNPRGDGATDETARQRADMIREIEYQSKAQQSYVAAGGHMIRRSYGYIKLYTDWEPGTMNRVIKIVAVANPDVIYLDPDAKQPDWSDCQFSFEVERMRERDFRRRFGNKAKITTFGENEMAAAPQWITSGDSGKHVQVAAYNRLETKPYTLCTLADGSLVNLSDPDFEGAQLQRTGNGEALLFPNGRIVSVHESRQDNEHSVVQYMTNGLEILSKEPLDFNEIPIIPMFGPAEWVSDGGTVKMVLHSAVRKTRGAYKGYCFTRSAQLERLGQDPKVPYEGYEGSFDTSTDFASLGTNPVSYIEFKAVYDEKGNLLPFPHRTLADPQIQQYEIAAESFRRAVQASMGGSPLPVSAQRQNAKSGVALEKIEQSTDQGNYHFTDIYDRALERVGRMIDAALDTVYDTPREHGFRDEEGNYRVDKINQTGPNGEKVGFHTASGNHGVTISTGPSNQSQRDAADDFTAQLVQHPEVLGPNAPKVIALLVKLKNLGPIGDKIAQIIAPEDTDDPRIQQAQQAIQQLQQELQAAKAGDAIKKYVCDEQEKTKRVLGLTTIDQQDAETELEKMLGMLDQKFDRLHEHHMTLLQQQHEREQQAGQQAHAEGQQAAEHQNAAAMADKGHAAAMEQAEQAAELAPKPEPAKD